MRISLEDANAYIRQALAPLPSRLLSLEDALGCVAAQSVVSKIDQPPFPRSLMMGMRYFRPTVLTQLSKPQFNYNLWARF